MEKDEAVRRMSIAIEDVMAKRDGVEPALEDCVEAAVQCLDLVQSWQSIDTAPKGKAVLVYKSNTKEQYVAALITGAHGPGWCDQSGCELFKVTHWMALPASPQ